MWDAIQEPTIAEGFQDVLGAVARAVDEYTRNAPKRLNVQARVVAMSQVFGILIFAGVGFLGWLGVVGHETTAAILAALIGYWYGQRERQRG
jgi:hypothetical protein